MHVKNVHDLKIKVKEGTLNLSVDAMKWAYQGKKPLVFGSQLSPGNLPIAVAVDMKETPILKTRGKC